jgi:uncharacterized repeat protein (TIGR01451 family)
MSIRQLKQARIPYLTKSYNNDIIPKSSMKKDDRNYKNMNKSLLILPTAALLIALNAVSVHAAGNNYGSPQCQPIYGGGDSCIKTPQFEINKTVQNPTTKAYVDNLSVSDPKYAPTQVVLFKITVKNTSADRLTNIVIKDTFPTVVEFAGGIGDYDANSKTLIIKLDKLDSNEVRDFYIQAKVLAKDKLTQGQNVICDINRSTITIGDKTAQDNSQFCIEKTITAPTPGTNPPTTKGGQPVNPGTTTVNPPTTKGGLPVYPPTTATTTPKTGPESLALIGLIPSALGGLYLRRKTN